MFTDAWYRLTSASNSSRVIASPFTTAARGMGVDVGGRGVGEASRDGSGVDKATVDEGTMVIPGLAVLQAVKMNKGMVRNTQRYRRRHFFISLIIHAIITRPAQTGDMPNQ
jgi:hypothetical protein